MTLQLSTVFTFLTLFTIGRGAFIIVLFGLTVFSTLAFGGGNEDQDRKRRYSITGRSIRLAKKTYRLHFIEEIAKPEGLGIRVALFESALSTAGVSSIEEKGCGVEVLTGENSSLAVSHSQVRLTGDVMGLLVCQILKQLFPEVQLRFFLAQSFNQYISALDLLSQTSDVALVGSALNFDTYGNFDGEGPINARVSEAIKKNSLTWIQSAGNLHHRVWSGKNHQAARDVERTYAFKVGELAQGHDQQKGNVRIVLTWSDFDNDIDYSSLIDLGFSVFDSQGNTIAKSSQVQGVMTPDARDVVSLPLSEGEYRIGIDASNATLEQLKSLSIRLSVVSQNREVEMDGATLKEDIGIPADNKDVVTVGDFSRYSSYSEQNQKPDVYLPSLFQLPKQSGCATELETKWVGDAGAARKEYETIRGTSVCAAYTVALWGIYKALYGEFPRPPAPEEISVLPSFLHVGNLAHGGDHWEIPSNTFYVGKPIDRLETTEYWLTPENANPRAEYEMKFRGRPVFRMPERPEKYFLKTTN